MKNKTLNLRISSDLHEFIKEYAAYHQTTITQVVTDFFMQLHQETKQEAYSIGIPDEMGVTTKVCKSPSLSSQ